MSTPLRQSLVRELTLRGCSPRTIEACHLRIQDLHSDRMQIRVEQGKGRKDRYTILSSKLLEQLRAYWRVYRPAHWLFPSRRDPDQPLPDGTAQRLYHRAVKRAGL